MILGDNDERKLEPDGETTGWPGECVLRFVNTAHLKGIDGGRFYGALIEIARGSRAVPVIIE